MRTKKAGSLAQTVFDLAGAAALIILLSPILVAIALLVKATSRGPVLFVQKRLGKGGAGFRLYKFRTMCAGAEEILHSTPTLHGSYVASGYKLSDRDDPRITLIGRLLRRSGLDELPQLVNVLGGDMSLVGPRPIVPPELERYPEYLSLVRDIRPGITGCWQVSGATCVDYARRAELERHYVTNRSLRLDVSLLLQTIRKLGSSFAPAAIAPLTVHPRQSEGIAAAVWPATEESSETNRSWTSRGPSR
jgi:exopolysaccharide production protein ExoY